MKLVEITRCRDTSEGTVKMLVAFAESLGKTVVHCKDTPGFIVNRLLVPYLLEAIEMWERRDASLDNIDRAMRLGAGHPMGPFELADHVGLDTLLHILSHWVERHPEERAFRLNATVRQLVANGRFGKKCGYGFFKYDQSGRIVKENGEESIISMSHRVGRWPVKPICDLEYFCNFNLEAEPNPTINEEMGPSEMRALTFLIEATLSMKWSNCMASSHILTCLWFSNVILATSAI
ncbi:hypothetical protein TcWFU_008375 [Taenia crassiceps]|uniref:3-hydroxyacyl-CoA dehydrogenase C-terminal domain-containing protein n=1 Tax=Taenia crassiceps TaxID=6207 RepID=A0ABR4Q9N0_9CEST